MLLSGRIWISPPIYILFLVNGAIHQGAQIPLFRQWELSFWRWSAIPRCKRRLKQSLTKSSMEDFPNIAISFPFPISWRSLKKFIGMLQLVVCFRKSFHHAKCVSTSSRWEPVGPLGRPLLPPNIVITSWHLYLIKRHPA